MSLLRNARRCHARQHVHELLNAFVTPTHNGAWLQQQEQTLREADRRRDAGELCHKV